jgi:cytochrome d ubiquinol oxidase subunit I
MVGLGTAMAVVALWALVVAARRKNLTFDSSDRWLLVALSVIAPFGFLATEAGWFVTEVGRQPWMIFGVLRTSEGVTPMPGLLVSFLLITLLYCALGAVVVWLLWRQIIRTSQEPFGRRAAPPSRERPS